MNPDDLVEVSDKIEGNTRVRVFEFPVLGKKYKTEFRMTHGSVIYKTYDEKGKEVLPLGSNPKVMSPETEIKNAYGFYQKFGGIIFPIIVLDVIPTIEELEQK